MSITKLHASMTKITLALFTAASSLALSSCQDEDYGFTSDEVRASVYKRNFESAIGEISEDQIWDFSSYNLRKLGLAGGPSANRSGSTGQTRALDGLVTKYNNDPSKWYTVSSSTITWLNAHLKEKVDNTEYTSPFEWVPDAGSGPKGVFYIIPIYQGQTGMVWNLELVDINIAGGINNSTLLWTKSENIRYTQDYNNWEEFFYESGVDAKSSYRRLDFANAFSKISSSTTDLKVAFSVNTQVTGSFYLTIGGNRVRLAHSNAQEFVESAGANNTDGVFTFKPTKNVSITSSQGLSQTDKWNYNIVDFSKLKGLTINGTEVNSNVLKTLSFEIPNNDDLPAADQLFQHWSRDYIRVYVHYNGGGDPEYINLFDLATEDSYTKHNTVNKYNVQTRPIKIDMNKIEGTSFAFNLRTIKRTEGDSPYSEIGDDHRSDGGFMSLITHFSEPVIVKSDFKELMKRDFNIDLIDNFEYKVIGCEDAGYNGKDSDHDFNDVVFLLVGDKLPNQVIKKRYMIEDLGSTLDFDFNDIVVDVTETSTTNDDGTKNYSQTAVIKHLRGTIPFRVKIGNKYFGNVDGNDSPIMRGHNSQGINFDPSTYNNSAHYEDYSWTATQVNVAAGTRPSLRDNYWDPEKNNILVEVWPSYASEDGNVNNVYWTGGTSDSKDNIKEEGQTKYNNVQIRKIVEFPKTGQVPYIIATDQTVMWMDECVNIPRNWVETNPQNYPNYPTFEIGQDTDETENSGSGIVGQYGNPLTNRTYATVGSIVLNNTETALNSSTIVISKDDINKAYLGDVLVVKVKGDVYDSSRLNFMQTSDTSKGIKNVGTNGGVIVTGDYEIPMTEEIMNSLRTNGLTISGTNVTVESVTVRSGVPDDRYYNTATSKPKTTADVAAGFWVIAENKILMNYSRSNGVTIPQSDLQQLCPGDKIVVKVSGLRSDSYFGFKKLWESGWPGITYSNYNMTGGTSVSGGNIASTGDITLEVTESNYEELTGGDILISGDRITIESVSVVEVAKAKIKGIVNSGSNTGRIKIEYNGITKYDELKVPCNQSVTYTLTAEPASGYSFTQWSNGNKNPSRTETMTFTQPEEKPYYTEFVQNLFDYSQGWDMVNVDAKFTAFADSSNPEYNKLVNGLNSGKRNLIVIFKSNIIYNKDGKDVHYNYHINAGNTQLDGSNHQISYSQSRIDFSLTDDDVAKIIENNTGFYIWQEYEYNASIIAVAIY